MKLKLYKDIRNYTIKFMSGVCITTILMSADGSGNIIKKFLVPASKPNTLEELLPESEKNKEIDADLLGFLDLADITKDYVEDVTVSHISVNGKEQVIYYTIERDDENNIVYLDIEMYEPISYSKKDDNYTKLYDSEYIKGDIVELSSACLEDYYEMKTGKKLNMLSVKTIGDIAIIKRLLDKGNTIYIPMTDITKERITTLKNRGVLKPILPDYSIEDYTTSKIKTR